MSQNKNYISLPKFTEVSLDISDLQSKYYIWKIPKSHSLAGLIEFKGTYLYGSSGDDDALFIKWKINEFCELELPQTISGLIVDFRNLDYQWGDNLDVDPQELRRMKKPVRIVVQQEYYEIFKGVLGDQELVTDLKVACSEIIAELNKK